MYYYLLCIIYIYSIIVLNVVEFFCKRCLEINKLKRVGTYPLVPNPRKNALRRDPFRRLIGLVRVILLMFS